MTRMQSGVATALVLGTLAMPVPAFAAKTNFPKFDNLHAHAEVTVPVNMSRSDAFTKVKKLVETNADSAVPPGKYELKEAGENDYVWAVRTTANGQYKDDVLFEFADAGGKDSSIHALSRS